jgi:AraC-like DNA-binding protein
MAFAKSIVLAYGKHGLSPDNALKLAQIAPPQLQTESAHITARQMEVLSGTAMQELDDEGLGAFSRKLPWGSYGMLARASISSPNLALALKRWCRHHSLLTHDIQLKLSVSGETASITINEAADMGALREFCLVHVLRNIHGTACWLIDSRIALQGATFPFAAPPHAGAYAYMFPGPRVFNAPSAAIHFHVSYLDLPLRRDEAALRQMLKRALPLTVLQYRRDRLLVQQVRQALADPAAASHTAATLATALNLSARSLHRQLNEEGASLQQLKDEVRFERAKHMLLRTEKPIKQVAAAAGFSNEKSFTRAFGQWAGETPGNFRKRSA